MSFKSFVEEEYGFKFRNNLNFVMFILMNILATPGIWLIALLGWGVIGFVASIILFILVYQIWKLHGNHTGKLSFCPAFLFGSKTYKFRK